MVLFYSESEIKKTTPYQYWSLHIPQDNLLYESGIFYSKNFDFSTYMKLFPF